MKTHDLKCLQPWFSAVRSGEKNFEVRLNDRRYRVGDILLLREYQSHLSHLRPTGEIEWRRVSYILHGGQFGIQEGYVVMGLEKTKLGSS